MTRVITLLTLVVLLSSCQNEVKEDEKLLENLMKTRPQEFDLFLDSARDLEIQIIYTQINRDSLNRPAFKTFNFRVDSTEYFYPASTVKLPLVLLALEKLNKLKVKGLDKFTPMFHDSVYSGQVAVTRDSTSESALPSIAHYATKILVVSDNDAYNRLYEFMGQKETNNILKSKGYNLRILHRLERALSPDQNRHTEAVRFVRNDSLIYSQPMGVNPDSIRPPRLVKKGTGFMRSDQRVNEPFDFTYKNAYSLADQQEILKAILFPDAIDSKKRFELAPEDRTFVLQYMSQLPRETSFPPYKKDTTLYDAYCKFLMYGNGPKPIPPGIRIFNKVGDAYGFLIDNAFVVDFDNDIEFMLSAVINTNTDGVYNDGQYEYERLGYPFMKSLGQLIYKYELGRKRIRKPDLSEFKMQYDRP